MFHFSKTKQKIGKKIPLLLPYRSENFRMTIWSRHIAQNMNENFEKLRPEHLGKIFQIFSFWTMRRLHIFIVKIIDL